MNLRICKRIIVVIIVIISAFLLIKGSNILLQELGFKYIEPLSYAKINLNTSNSYILNLKFNRKTIYYITYWIKLKNGSGSNPKGGQSLGGYYILKDSNGNVINHEQFNLLLISNQSGGELFRIDTETLDLSGKYTLEVTFTSNIENFLDYYSPEINFVIKRNPSLQIIR